MKIFFASDHAGFDLKSKLITFVQGLGHETEDCGPASLHPDDDFTDYIFPCAEKVARNTGSFGIILGASGEGEAMAANRVKGIRAAVYYGDASAEQKDESGNILNLIQSVRAHNNANVLSLGARFVDIEEAKKVITLWLKTSFSGDKRHLRRIEKIEHVHG